MPVTLSHRTTWTSPDGTPLTTGGVHRSDAEVSTLAHFTAPVGTNYGRVLDVSGKAGEDAFGAIGGASYVLVVNRSTEAMTLRLEGTGSASAYVVLPAGCHFGLGVPGQTIVNVSKGERLATISAKLSSKAGTVEVLGLR